MLKRIFNALAALVVISAPHTAHGRTTPAGPQAATAERIIVLPFENRSNLKEYNWVGESFADSLAELLNVPGLAVVSGDERGVVYQKLSLPETVIPARGTAIKIGRTANATLVVLGTYEVVPARDEKSVASVRGSA